MTDIEKPYNKLIESESGRKAALDAGNTENQKFTAKPLDIDLFTSQMNQSKDMQSIF